MQIKFLVMHNDPTKETSFWIFYVRSVRLAVSDAYLLREKNIAGWLVASADLMWKKMLLLVARRTVWFWKQVQGSKFSGKIVMIDFDE